MLKKEVFKNRRKLLLEKIKTNYPNIKQGAILLVSDFENITKKFRQESSFYYLTGIEEPGTFLVINLDGKETLFIPNYEEEREKWVKFAIKPEKKYTEIFGIDDIKLLGEKTETFSFPTFFNQELCENLCENLKKIVENNGTIFSLNFSQPRISIYQKIILNHLNNFVFGLEKTLVDVTNIVASIRRIKSKDEIELIYKAIDLTITAQCGAAVAIQENVKECEISAGIEYIFQESCAQSAFQPIVASGANGNILHYAPTNYQMKNGEIVIVDIGAELNYYCADITRTYPVSKSFTKKQKELYQMVLNAQEYIASKAAPGFWINNKDVPEKSLNHLAIEFFKKHNYEKYFSHSIGHFLGLDVHDIGDHNDPLQEGDVITIEPGIYIPEEKMGIRIEDDYWIIKNGSICLSEDLPKDIDTIEEMMQTEIDEQED